MLASRTGNALLLAYKPAFMTSNAFLQRIKRLYGVKKAGFSGILDPFAQGSLIIALNAYTKLLPHIPTEPKIYEATLWLGAESTSLDCEHITHIHATPTYSLAHIQQALAKVHGDISYTPPIFSAKKINGKRAYTLARMGQDIALKRINMRVYSIKLLCYAHPFVSFKASVSKGAYIRSLGALIAQHLQTKGALSALKRISEGGLRALAHTITPLNPLEILPYPIICMHEDYASHFYHGKSLQPITQHLLQAILVQSNLPLSSITKSPPPSSMQTASLLESSYHISHLSAQAARMHGRYIVRFEKFFSIIELHADGSALYLLNRIDHAHTL